MLIHPSKRMSNVASTVSRMFGLVLNEREKDSESKTGTRLLLAGPNSSGKTSLLFEYAVSYAEQEETVLFTAPKPISRLPLFVNGRSQPKPGILKLINFVYLATYTDLINFFAKVHLSETRTSLHGRPKHVLIDDFDSYFQEECSRTEETNRIAKCLAYIVDAVEYFSERRAGDTEKTNCHLLVAETVSGDSVAIEKQSLYQHWITNFLSIKAVGQDLFEVKHVGCKNSANCMSGLGIHYHTTQKGIELTEVSEDE